MGRRGRKARARLGPPCPGSVGWPHGDCLQVLPGARPQCLRALDLNGTAGPRTPPTDAEGGLHGRRGAGGSEVQRPSSVRHTWRRRPEDGHSQLSTVTRTLTVTPANVHGAPTTCRHCSRCLRTAGPSTSPRVPGGPCTQGGRHEVVSSERKVTAKTQRAELQRPPPGPGPGPRPHP